MEQVVESTERETCCGVRRLPRSACSAERRQIRSSIRITVRAGTRRFASLTAERRRSVVGTGSQANRLRSADPVAARRGTRDAGATTRPLDSPDAPLSSSSQAHGGQPSRGGLRARVEIGSAVPSCSRSVLLQQSHGGVTTDSSTAYGVYTRERERPPLECRASNSGAAPGGRTRGRTSGPPLSWVSDWTSSSPVTGLDGVYATHRANGTSMGSMLFAAWSTCANDTHDDDLHFHRD